MAKKKEKFKNDRALRFYYDVLGLERLHYGLWDDADERNLEGAKIAQKRYEDFLVDEIELLTSDPAETKVLDVGCGSGIMSETLYNKKFLIEGLSPDLYQKDVFEKRIPVKFHLARFQNFEPIKKYDIVLMSESAQYIPLKRLFVKADECLKPSGYLMVCDYFTFDDATGPMAKSGHKLSAFLKTAEENGYKVIKERDITKETIPTLDAAKIFTDKYIFPSIEIFSDKFQERRPRLFKFVKWIFRKQIAKAYKNVALIDSADFERNKCYRFFIFQK
jgi:MPBQ/MSBQ methyltransferase